MGIVTQKRTKLNPSLLPNRPIHSSAAAPKAPLLQEVYRYYAANSVKFVVSK